MILIAVSPGIVCGFVSKFHRQFRMWKGYDSGGRGGAGSVSQFRRKLGSVTQFRIERKEKQRLKQLCIRTAGSGQTVI